MVVVIPNSEGNSWWTGDWEKMLTDELIPHIDSNYRTIRDARYRMTAGCSMGGQGAYGVALTNPEHFSRAASFFGALSMAPNNEEDALKIAENESKEYLDYFALYFNCGNQDVYGFGEPAIALNQLLAEKGVEHEFFIENGGHDSAFYISYFNDALAYVRNHMYQTEDCAGALFAGKITTHGQSAGGTVQFEAKAGVEELYNVIPSSSYTGEVKAELSVPVIIEVVQDEKVVSAQIEGENVVNSENLSTAYSYDFTKYVDEAKGYEIVLKAAVFDKEVVLDTVVIE